MPHNTDGFRGYLRAVIFALPDASTATYVILTIWLSDAMHYKLLESFVPWGQCILSDTRGKKRRFRWYLQPASDAVMDGVGETGPQLLHRRRQHNDIPRLRFRFVSAAIYTGVHSMHFECSLPDQTIMSFSPGGVDGNTGQRSEQTEENLTLSRLR